MTETKARHPLIYLAWFVALVVLAFGWPTLYRYDRMGDYIVRINRLTGVMQGFGANGWTTLGK